MDVCPVLDFARRLAGYKRSIWLRFVLVPGLTDRDEDIAQIAKFSAGLGNMQRVDVLPFHQMGRFIWKELKYNYTLEYIQPPSLEAIEKVCSFAPRDSRPSGKAASIHGT
jgi:pyruvate formate lyase activating enzyme